MEVSDGKKPCVKCSKGGGVLTCDGCQQSFCTKHFVEHRQELQIQLDSVGQERDLLRRDLSEDIHKHPILERIDTWERESIGKIQTAAQIARADLRHLLDRTKDELKTSVEKMTAELQLCQQEDDYTEIELKRWTERLNELRKTLEWPSNINIEFDNHTKSTISLIKICNKKEQKSPSSIPPSGPNEKFSGNNSEIILSENDLMATCHSKSSMPGGIMYGFNLYSSGTHDVNFRIEKKGLARLFFGIFSSSKKRVETISDRNNSVYGWWDINLSVLNGIKQESSTEYIITTGDEITLTLDCDHRQLQLHHHNLNRKVHLPIDVNKCPFPWKIVVKLTSNTDCLRIFQESNST